MKANVDDSYLLNRFRFQVNLHTPSWFRVTAQVQDARAGFQNPPIGPPNTVRWDLKLAYAEIGAPDKHWFSLRVGRQLINYNNTIISNSEWRNQARSYDAAVVNLNAKREHLGIFAASAVVPQAYGVSPHQEGNNIYGAYGRIDDFLVPHSNLEPFFLWRVQPAEVVEAAVGQDHRQGEREGFWRALQGASPHGARLRGRGDLRRRHSGNAKHPRLGGAGRRGIPVPQCSGQAARLYPVRLRLGQQQSGDRTQRTPPSTRSIRRPTTALASPTSSAGRTLRRCAWEPPLSLTGGSASRRRGWTFGRLDALDSIYNTSGSAIVTNKTDHGRHLGAEIDGYSWYELNKHFNLGGGIGYFGGGQFLTNVTTSHSYTHYYYCAELQRQRKEVGPGCRCAGSGG